VPEDAPLDRERGGSGRSAWGSTAAAGGAKDVAGAAGAKRPARPPSPATVAAAPGAALEDAPPLAAPPAATLDSLGNPALLRSAGSMRLYLSRWAAAEEAKARFFGRHVLAGALKKHSPALSLLRKADRKDRARPRTLIAEFCGVLYGARRRRANEVLELLAALR